MDYTKEKLPFKVKKFLRYLRLYGPSRTIAKVRGQYHMQRLSSAGAFSSKESGKSVAIVGCGNYSYNVIAYYLLREKGHVIRCTMDVSESRARSLALRTNANYSTTDIEKVLEDENVELVYIASNHATHAEYAIKFIEAGKHVHIEKPHVVNQDQLTRLVKAMSHSTAKVRMGFNRPSSRFGQKILDLMNNQPGASMINWFIAGHEIDPSHWYFHPEEGGRVLGNLCHWTDFSFHQLGGIEAFPITIYPVVAEKSDCDISVSLVGDDSSIATITFSAKGHTFEGVREKLNVHKGNLLLTMSDYETLRVDLVDKKRVYRNLFRDHGHRNNILNSYSMLNTGPGESIEYVFASAKLFLAVKDALENREITVVDVSNS